MGPCCCCICCCICCCVGSCMLCGPCDIGGNCMLCGPWDIGGRCILGGPCWKRPDAGGPPGGGPAAPARGQSQRRQGSGRVAPHSKGFTSRWAAALLHRGRTLLHVLGSVLHRRRSLRRRHPHRGLHRRRALVRHSHRLWRLVETGRSLGRRRRSPARGRTLRWGGTMLHRGWATRRHPASASRANRFQRFCLMSSAFGSASD